MDASDGDEHSAYVPSEDEDVDSQPVNGQFGGNESSEDDSQQAQREAEEVKNFGDFFFLLPPPPPPTSIDLFAFCYFFSPTSFRSFALFFLYKNEKS